MVDRRKEGTVKTEPEPRRGHPSGYGSRKTFPPVLSGKERWMEFLEQKTELRLVTVLKKGPEVVCNILYINVIRVY